MQHGKIAAITLAAAMMAAPALAQTASHTTPDAPGTGNGTTGTTTPGVMSRGTTGMNTTGAAGMGSAGPATMGSGASGAAATPSDRNPVLTDNGNVRASKVIGSSVYNDKDQKIGSVDDIILGRDNKPARVVLSVGGFLGIDAKLVAVPYDKLQFGDTNKNSDNRVIMPGATKDSLTNMQTYNYASK
jgi:sporulation protein YlmC with PRC-barrel domain